jgi:hypothetical protein
MASHSDEQKARVLRRNLGTGGGNEKEASEGDKNERDQSGNDETTKRRARAGQMVDWTKWKGKRREEGSKQAMSYVSKEAL